MKCVKILFLFIYVAVRLKTHVKALTWYRGVSLGLHIVKVNKFWDLIVYGYALPEFWSNDKSVACDLWLGAFHEYELYHKQKHGIEKHKGADSLST